MFQKKIQLVFWLLLGIFLSAKGLAGEVNWKNSFTFYGDNTEFFEPFRLRETLLGQQGKSILEAVLGRKTFLSAGVFADFRSVSQPQVMVRPMLSFEYRNDGTRLHMGTLQTLHRHGFLEPLEVTTLEITRPVEYGLQWLQDDPAFDADVFLNWQLLNIPGQPETFDYGGVMKFWPENPISLEFQMHGYHLGGKLYFVTLYNNYVPTFGIRFKTPLGSFGELRLDVFGLISGTMNGWDWAESQWGGGGYFRAGLLPGNGWQFFGIAWRGRDFYSKEGDFNYSSFSEYSNYYQADRFYADFCGRKEFPMEGNSFFAAELRSHWSEGYWAFSFRFMVSAPFNLPLLKDAAMEKKNEEGSKL